MKFAKLLEMKQELKELLKYIALVAICIMVFLFCANKVFGAPANPNDIDIKNTFNQEITENSYSGRKAVGMYINTYTGAKVAVCLEDINNCLIEWIAGNTYMQNVQLTLRIFQKPILEIVDNAMNPQFSKLFEPSTILR